MPAKNLYRNGEEGIISHIYNKGVEKRIIFNDEEDYKVFQGFLKDYLTASQDSESIKKTFTVHGQVFRGIPHQPKNYFNKVELIAYSLMPNHFHLLLHQKTRGSLESFIRSLCTRYSMYFNKKYQRTGALFEGPYKSIQIKDKPSLLYLTRYIHHTGNYSSYAEYLGSRETLWVKPNVVLSFFGKRTGGYKGFVEKNEPDQREKELIEGITFESETQHLEGRDLAIDAEKIPPEPSQTPEKIHLDANLEPPQRMLELLAVTVVFSLLLILGIRNIMISETQSPNFSPTPIQSEPTPAVLSVTKEIKEIKPIILTIKINDGAASVNIRRKPTIDSEKIGEAKDSDTFEFISINSGWYEVKLTDGSTGFISETYITKND